MFSSSQPRRILAVTGIFTASTMPLTSRAVLSNSVIIAEPPPTRQTLRTGHPMLMSTEATPSDSSSTAASRISSGTEPNSCTASGWSAGQVSIELERLGLSLDQRTGIDQVGRSQAKPAQLAHRQAERQVGVACQRRKKQVGCQCQRAEAHRRYYSGALRQRRFAFCNQWRTTPTLSGPPRLRAKRPLS